MKHRPNTLVEFFSLFSIILGSLALSIFFISSWAHSLLFDTNYYLSIVAPLPKTQEISNAVSTYTMDRLFAHGTMEDKIRNALPEQAKFLAPSLSDELQKRLSLRTNQIIQSDQFTSVWVAANTLFHEKILDIIRGGSIISQVNTSQPLQNTSLQFDTSQLAQTIKNHLGSDNQLFTNTQIEQLRSIILPTYTKLQTVRQVVYWVTQFESMMAYVAFSLILFGIAISFSRQKALLIAAIIIMITMLLTLLTIQIVKTDLLQHITQPVYYAAANIVWDSFLANLRQTLHVTILNGLIITTFALLAGPYTWAKNIRQTIGIPQIQRNEMMQKIYKMRMFLAQYALWLRLLGIVILAIVLLTITTVTIATVVIGFSLLLIYLSLLTFIFPREKIQPR